MHLSDNPTGTALADLVRLGRQVRYTRTVDQYRALADVASAQGIVLVDAGHSYEEELLQAGTAQVVGEDQAPQGTAVQGAVRG